MARFTSLKWTSLIVLNVLQNKNTIKFTTMKLSSLWFLQHNITSFTKNGFQSHITHSIKPIRTDLSLRLRMKMPKNRLGAKCSSHQCLNYTDYINLRWHQNLGKRNLSNTSSTEYLKICHSASNNRFSMRYWEIQEFLMKKESQLLKKCPRNKQERKRRRKKNSWRN